jgi:retron-type reverse transcriptase
LLPAPRTDPYVRLARIRLERKVSKKIQSSAEFLEHRVGDQRIIRLIQKWLKAGVLEDGVVTVNEVGTGQGSVISPLLANIYLFYVLDLFAERWRRRSQ